MLVQIPVSVTLTLSASDTLCQQLVHQTNQGRPSKLLSCEASILRVEDCITVLLSLELYFQQLFEGTNFEASQTENLSISFLSPEQKLD